MIGEKSVGGELVVAQFVLDRYAAVVQDFVQRSAVECDRAACAEESVKRVWWIQSSADHGLPVQKRRLCKSANDKEPEKAGSLYKPQPSDDDTGWKLEARARRSPGTQIARGSASRNASAGCRLRRQARER